MLSKAKSLVLQVILHNYDNVYSCVDELYNYMCQIALNLMELSSTICSPGLHPPSITGWWDIPGVPLTLSKPPWRIAARPSPQRAAGSAVAQVAVAAVAAAVVKLVAIFGHATIITWVEP